MNIRYAITTRSRERWLGADDLAGVLHEDRTDCLGCHVEKEDRVLFLNKEIARTVRKQMCGVAYDFRIVKVPGK